MSKRGEERSAFDQLRHSKAVGITLVFAALLLAARWLLQVPTIHPDRLKALQTKTNATALLVAVKGFYSTYKAQPKVASKGAELLTEGSDGIELLTILLGKEEVTSAMENRKQIRFLIVEETKRKDKGGLFYSKRGEDAIPEGLYDAWGHPFHVRFASGEAQEIPDPFKPGEIIRDKIAIVYSYGKNGKPGDDDDIKTW